MLWNVRFDLYVDLTDEELLRAIYEASAVAKVTQRIPLLPEVRAKLNRLNIVRAVRGTTGIEGSDLSEDEVARVLEAPEGAKPVLMPARFREELETRNAARVMQFVAATLEAEPHLPLSEHLICHLHRLTTENIPYENNDPGHYRHHNVSVLEYVPPRGIEQIERLMATFVDWMNSREIRQWHPILRAVAAHFYLISIHPFGDGNGRTARAVESYLLYQGNLNQLGFYSLANFYYRERSTYVELLDYTRFQSGGNLTPFLVFAAKGLLGELELIQEEVLNANREVAFHDYAIEYIRSFKGIREPTRRRATFLVELLSIFGTLSLQSLKGDGPLGRLYSSEVSPRTLDRDLGFLVKNRLVVVQEDKVSPNLSVMDEFTRPIFNFGPEPKFTRRLPPRQ